MTYAGIFGGALVVQGRSSTGSTVTLDGTYTTPVDAKTRIYAFKLVYFPKTCMVTVTGAGKSLDALVADCGPQGLAARGNWSMAETYRADDVVVHRGSAWLAQAQKLANKNRIPSEKSPFWQLLVAKGDNGLPGPNGAKGPKGDIGAQGAKGAAGPKGDTGTAGPKGAKGDAGIAGAKGDTGAAGVAGPKGDTGAAGAKGDKGDAGVAGAKGDKGDAGVAGAKGDTGAAGPTGATGATGAPGAPGSPGSMGLQGATGATGATGARGAGVAAAYSLPANCSSGQYLVMAYDTSGTAVAICIAP